MGAVGALDNARLFAVVEDAVEATPVGSLELKVFGRPTAAYEIHDLRGD